ncbi:MAG: 3-isopropylmalate dehydratase large subunit [Promethearchaeota archaeon]
MTDDGEGTIAEKILRSHATSPEADIGPGRFVEAAVDLVMVHEQLGGRIHVEYEKLGLDHIWDPEKVVFLLDHWVPAPDLRAAKMHQTCRAFAEKYHFVHDLGMTRGICHQVVPEFGFARPGMLICGSDSHTTAYGALNCFSTGIGATDVAVIFASGKLWFRVPPTIKFVLSGSFKRGVTSKDLILSILGDIGADGALYKAMEFAGPGLGEMSVASRFTVANMSVEAGAKCCIFHPDGTMERWLEEHGVDYVKPVTPSRDALYEREVTLDLSALEPVVALPDNPDNVVPVAEAGDIEIDQAFLGSCTNGRLEDLRVAAEVMKGKKVHPRVRMVVIPASQRIYLEALREGLISTFIEAGASVGNPTCGPCVGGHLGVLGPGETCISSSNRNFKGRMGDPTARVYLASPVTVAKSAIAGKITPP